MSINIESALKEKISETEFTIIRNQVGYTDHYSSDSELYRDFFREFMKEHYTKTGLEDLQLLSQSRKLSISLKIRDHKQLKYAILIKRVLEKVGITLKLSHNEEKLVALAQGDKTLSPLLRDSFFAENKDDILPLVEKQKVSCEINNELIFPEFYQEKGSVSESSAKLWEYREKFSDAVFVVKDREFKVSKLLLSSSSEYFLKMFTVETKESKQDKVEIKLNVIPASFEKLLEYIYTKTTSLKEVPLEDLEHLTSFAHMATLDGFEKLCINEYRSKMTSKNFFEILKAAKNLNNDSLKAHCIFFRDMHPNWFKNHIDLKECDLEGLSKVLDVVQFIEKRDFEAEIADVCMKKINETNFSEISQLARKTNNETLQQLCLLYAESNWKQMNTTLSYDIRKQVLLLRMGWNEKDYLEFVNERPPVKK